MEATGEELRTTWSTCAGDSKACRRTPAPGRVRSKREYRLQRGDTGGPFSGKTIRLITLWIAICGTSWPGRQERGEKDG